jgi:hypothetical protein
MKLARFAPVSALTFWAALGAAPLFAGAALDAERSVLAMLTHKAGIASGLAHDHLVTAPLSALTLTLDPAAPEATRAKLELRVDQLEIDHFAARAKWKGRLRELGVGPEKLDPVSEDDRAKVRAAMLDEEQLDAGRFPQLSAELVALRSAADAPKPFTGFARLKLTIHGKSVERDVPASWKVENGVVSAEALGEFKFTEFGIEPYSGPLGAVKNRDDFHLFVALATKPD